MKPCISHLDLGLQNPPSMLRHDDRQVTERLRWVEANYGMISSFPRLAWIRRYHLHESSYMAVCQNLVPLVNIKIAGKWMFIPLKVAFIGIDPWPYFKNYRCISWDFSHRFTSFKSSEPQLRCSLPLASGGAISERFPGGWRPLRAAEHVVALHQAGQRSGGTDGADWGWISSASQEVFGVENDDFLSHRNWIGMYSDWDMA